MDWILDHLKFVVIAAVIIGSIVKSVLESKSQGPDGLPERTDDDTSDRSYRKMPPRMPSVPPPVQWTETPSSTYNPPPPLPTTAYTIPGAYEFAQEESAKMLKHQQDLAEHLRQIRENKATTTGGAAETRARIAASKGTSKRSATTQVPIRARLRDRAEIRRAFIMREILDKPVGLG